MLDVGNPADKVKLALESNDKDDAKKWKIIFMCFTNAKAIQKDKVI